MKIQNLFEDIEFKLLVLAASIGFIAKYLGFIPEEQLFSVTLFLIILLSFFELNKSKKIETYLHEINENALNIHNENVRIGRIGNRWFWDKDGPLTIGNTRNVVLRTKTVMTLLDSFKNYPDFSDILRKASKDVGISFGDDLKKELTDKRLYRYSSNINDKINLWVDYDSDTGMGKFDISDIKVSDNHISGNLKIKNSFTATDKSLDQNECLFFEGYLEGVFKKFIGVDVEIKEISCSCTSKSDLCVFSVNQK